MCCRLERCCAGERGSGAAESSDAKEQLNDLGLLSAMDIVLNHCAGVDGKSMWGSQVIVS